MGCQVVGELHLTEIRELEVDDWRGLIVTGPKSGNEIPGDGAKSRRSGSRTQLDATSVLRLRGEGETGLRGHDGEKKGH